MRQSQGCGARTFPEVKGLWKGSKYPLQIFGEEAEENSRIDSGGLSQSAHSRVFMNHRVLAFY